MIPVVELPAEVGSVRCRPLSGPDDVEVVVVAEAGTVRVDYTRVDAHAGTRSVFCVRQFARDDPELAVELARLRPAD